MSPQTRSSLLQRIRVACDHQAWQEFHDLYQPVVRAFALKMGLRPQDVEDLEQEVFQTISKEIQTFDYNRDLGRFSSWVFKITRYRVLMAFRRRNREPEPKSDSDVQSLLDKYNQYEAESTWDDVFQGQLFQEACQRVKAGVKPTTWHAFWLNVIEGKSISEISMELDLSPGALYVAKSRVVARLNEQMKLLNA